VTGANSAEAVIDLRRLGYARTTTTSNCGLPAGQYDVVLLDGRQRSIKAIETTLDWVSDFLSLTGVLIVWLDPLQPLSKSTSHGSTIHDCGEPFKLQSTLSEDRALPPPSTNANISGQACEADPGFRAPARHNLPTFAICATAIESRCQAYFSRYSGPGRRI